MRHASDGCIHSFLILSRISELDVMPDCAAASEITLTREDLIPPIARDSDPSSPTLVICDLLTITIGDVVHLLIHCRPISKRLSCLQPRPAVRRRKPPSSGFWVSLFLGPPWRHRARCPLSVGWNAD